MSLKGIGSKGWGRWGVGSVGGRLRGEDVGKGVKGEKNMKGCEVLRLFKFISEAPHTFPFPFPYANTQVGAQVNREAGWRTRGKRQIASNSQTRRIHRSLAKFPSGNLYVDD